MGIPMPGSCLESTGFNLSIQSEKPAYHSQNPKPVLSELSLADAASKTIAPTSPPKTKPLKLSIPDRPDWEGLKQDTQLLIFYQAVMVGVIYFLPEDISKWDKHAKNGNLPAKWDDNVRNLRLDRDNWDVNYIGHPYFGATYFVRARNRGYDRKGAFWYAAAMSAVYEYGFEAIFEPVSIQDLIFTPVAGAIVGEYFMVGRQKIINRIEATGKQSGWDTLGLFLTDPIGVINRKVTKSLGLRHDAKLEIQPVILAASPLARSEPNASPAEVYGIQARIKW